METLRQSIQNKEIKICGLITALVILAVGIVISVLFGRKNKTTVENAVETVKTKTEENTSK